MPWLQAYRAKAMPAQSALTLHHPSGPPHSGKTALGRSVRSKSVCEHGSKTFVCQQELEPLDSPLNQRFRKGVGGQRGLARGNPSCARDSGLFSVLFFLCPLRRRGTHFWRTFWLFLEANPLPPTPFRNL